MRIAALLLALTVTTACHAQANWDKTYPITAKPSLGVEVDDASVQVRSCGSCRAVHIRVDWHGSDSSRWNISEMQGGNGIHFKLKHREENSWLGSGWHGRSPEVFIESPGETDLTARSGDGSIVVTGLHGSVDVKTGDGSMQVSETAGPLRVSTGDGSVHVQHAEGTLYANTGDGSVNLTLQPGSVLQSSSNITSGDGSITMRVPGDLRADVDVSTGDGGIRCDLPLQSSANQRNHVHGVLNGGGPSLRLHSGD